MRWKSICWCRHDFCEHLTQIDKPELNCTQCKCKRYKENEQARWLSLNWEILTISICVGIIVIGLMMK